MPAQEGGGQERGDRLGVRRGVAFEEPYLVLRQLLDDPAPAPYGHPDPLRHLPVRPRCQDRRRGRLAPPRLGDLLVGGGDGALEQRGQALDQRIEQFARRTVPRIAAPAGPRVPGEHGPRLEPPAHPLTLGRVRFLDHACKAYGGGVLRRDGARQLRHPHIERADDSGGRTDDGLLTRRRIPHPVRQPGEQGRDGGGGQQPAAAAGRLGQFGDGEAGYVAQARLGEQRRVLT